MLRGSFPATQRGISLIELMVGIAISLILLAGVVTVMLRISTAGGESVQATRLNQQLRGTLDQVSKDLQRAGYVDWYDAWDDDDDSNPDDRGSLADVNSDGSINVLDFYQAAVPVLDLMGAVTLWSFPTPGTATGAPSVCTTNCDCILFSYDLNEDGAQGVGAGTAAANQNTANFELFGYRWNDGVIEMRVAGDTHSCNSGTWQDITDDNINITSLTFNMAYATAVGAGNDSTAYQFDASTGDWSWNNALQSTCTPVDNDNADPIPTDTDVLCLWRRKVDISITGTLSSDAAVTMTLNTDVKIKNDFFNSQP
ncbi:MAG: prepilin-type N-terminal cleavage/methylation domain-containing protein [Porticoccaceae bacterium]|nr:prepilin-type N-terminal cleavage/methylation domain-containing protein [Porticoccaceae bacterium]